MNIHPITANLNYFDNLNLIVDLHYPYINYSLFPFEHKTSKVNAYHLSFNDKFLHLLLLIPMHLCVYVFTKGLHNIAVSIFQLYILFSFYRRCFFLLNLLKKLANAQKHAQCIGHTLQVIAFFDSKVPCYGTLWINGKYLFCN